GLFWDAPQPAEHCLGYRVREYTASLRGLSLLARLGWKQACEKTPIRINGADFQRPDSCQSRLLFGGMRGVWAVEDASCAAYWDKFVDKGCVVKGIRLIQSRIQGVKFSEDKEKICTSTPATIRGVFYQRPHGCQDGFWGLYGQWRVVDQKC
ncbi:hypothetical protein FA15DRAFT_583596, partial [Coprinopsis marcescibilis]